jgi:hypothetical protein
MINDASIKCTDIHLKMCVLNEHISSSVEEAMKVDPVDGVASRVHGFRPETLGGLEFSKHRPRHID